MFPDNLYRCQPKTSLIKKDYYVMKILEKKAGSHIGRLHAQNDVVDEK